MKCPLCGGTASVASTIEKTDTITRRKLKCMNCDTIFITIEKFERFTRKNKDVMKETKEICEASMGINNITNSKLTKDEAQHIIDTMRNQF